MKTLEDLHIEQQQKEKKTRIIFIILTSILSVALIALFLVDPWNIANNKETKAIETRHDEFSKKYINFLDESKYVEAFYLEYNLNLYDVSPDLYSLLSDGERIVEYITNVQEGKAQDNYYSFDYLVNNFYNEYAYAKKYKAPSNYIDDIKNDIEEYITAYNYMSLDELNKIKEANNYD